MSERQERAEDCLRYIKPLVSSEEYRRALILIELYAAQCSRRHLLAAMEDTRDRVGAVINAPLLSGLLP